MNSVIDRLKKLAEETGFHLEIAPEVDGSYSDATLHNDDISIDVAVPVHGGVAYAYSLESPGLPRELYSDNLSKDFTEEQRSEEVLRNLEGLIKRRIKFRARPTLLGKSAGLIDLPIDGRVQVVRLKSNYFKLPRDE
ncbi:MAG TPA: hypothetical protein VF466_05105 [Candidatus Saccharimonadales bacterium]